MTNWAALHWFTSTKRSWWQRWQYFISSEFLKFTGMKNTRENSKKQQFGLKQFEVVLFLLSSYEPVLWDLFILCEELINAYPILRSTMVILWEYLKILMTPSTKSHWGTQQQWTLTQVWALEEADHVMRPAWTAFTTLSALTAYPDAARRTKLQLHLSTRTICKLCEIWWNAKFDWEVLILLDWHGHVWWIGRSFVVPDKRQIEYDLSPLWSSEPCEHSTVIHTHTTALW